MRTRQRQGTGRSARRAIVGPIDRCASPSTFQPMSVGQVPAASRFLIPARMQRGRRTHHVLPAATASGIVLVLVSWAMAIPLERMQEPLIASFGLAIVLGGALEARDRTRRVRWWIAIGFAGWTASTLAIALRVSIGGLPAEGLSVLLLAFVVLAAGGAYWAALHGRISRRQELAVYLDATIMAAATTALVLGLLRINGDPSTAVLSTPLLHGIAFLAILAATLILDLAVLAETKFAGAYAILIGLAMVGLGFVARSGGLWTDSEVLSVLVSIGVLIVAFGAATWSDRMDPSPTYASAAARLRAWLPLAAVAVTLLSLFANRQAQGGVNLLSDLSIALVLAATVIRQSVLLTERESLLGEAGRKSEQLERRLASQRQLLAITERLLVHREQTAVFEAVADTLAEVVPHDTLSIYLVDREASCLVPILARDMYAEQILASRPALGQGITGDVIAKGEAEIINDSAHDPRVVHVPGTPADEDEAMIVAPIRSADGVIGALNIYRLQRGFDQEDLELVRLFTNHVAIALENATIHDQLMQAAVTDPLTGLPNRRLFAQRVEQALSRRRKSGGHVAVLFLDVDGFKLVNDSLGHDAGDAALRAVAARLRDSARSSDTVARLGGDEFGVLCEGIEAEGDAIAACRRIEHALATPVSVGGRTVPVRASIGVALERGTDRLSAEQLLRDADTAMYLAKHTHRGRFRIFEEAMRARQISRLELEEDLRRGILDGQFYLAYQPIFNLSSGEVVAVEGLLRWNHPTREVQATEFIELAEESGLIVELGALARQRACHEFQALQQQSRRARRLGLSLNISPRELAEQGFAESVREVLANSGLAPDRLTLEITEGVMLSDETSAIAALRDLRAMGIHIAIDDFGTGYSSLSYLKRLPVDGLKIDRSFIEGLGIERERSAIVGATIAFARALGLVVTAEGIETADQLRHLRKMRCQLGQGYLWAPAMMPSEVESFLETDGAGSDRAQIPLRGSAA